MPIYVYHNPHFLDCFRRELPGCIDPACLYLAAIVDTDEPETAYRLTQHVLDPWHDHPAVTTVVRSRSTSVGDVLATEDSRLLAVMPAGYEELEGALPAGETVLSQNLEALVETVACLAGISTAETVVDGVVEQVRHLYNTLNFAMPLLVQLAESLPQQVQDNLPDAHLLRFAAEQARWALRHCSGEALEQTDEEEE